MQSSAMGWRYVRTGTLATLPGWGRRLGRSAGADVVHLHHVQREEEGGRAPKKNKREHGSEVTEARRLSVLGREGGGRGGEGRERAGGRLGARMVHLDDDRPGAPAPPSFSSKFVCLPPPRKTVPLHPGGRRRPRPLVRLLCFPAAGVGAWVFHAWSKILASDEDGFGSQLGIDIEVVPIELPGRNSRFRGAILAPDELKLEKAKFDAIDQELSKESEL